MKDQKRKGRITELQVVDFIATIWKDQLLLIPVTGENKSIMYISEIYPDNGIKSTVNLVQYFLPEIQLKQYL